VSSDALRAALDALDQTAVRALLIAAPELAAADLPPSPGHPLGASPLCHVAMLRFDTATRCWRDVRGTAELARLLLAAGAPVDGSPGSRETPLVTAASYGDAAVAQVLLGAGADPQTPASAASGGIPGGTPLLHAAVFGMTAVVDVLVSAGAAVPDVVTAAAAGDVSGFRLSAVSATDRLLALVAAAHHQRLDVVDTLVAGGTPLDEPDPVWGRHPLRLAAADGRPDAVRHLLALGADPRRRDADGRTPLDLCRDGMAARPDDPGYPATLALLEPVFGGASA
jgi:uncharacterized protein